MKDSLAFFRISHVKTVNKNYAHRRLINRQFRLKSRDFEILKFIFNFRYFSLGILESKVIHFQIDGEFKRREHPLSLQEESLSRPQYCEYFPELWFNDSLRYGPKCIKILQSVPGVRPQISPYFLEGCTNPLELVVFWGIM